ncbi:MAG: hypothetical protein MPJ50_19770, partial [Pirellulales bacterium]|nr:hypothetical protein [Pirellulales bacterium]
MMTALPSTPASLALCVCLISAFVHEGVAVANDSIPKEERAVRFLIKRGADPIQPGIERKLGLKMVDDADTQNIALHHGGLPDFPIIDGCAVVGPVKGSSRRFG